MVQALRTDEIGPDVLGITTLKAWARGPQETVRLSAVADAATTCGLSAVERQCVAQRRSSPTRVPTVVRPNTLTFPR